MVVTTKPHGTVAEHGCRPLWKVRFDGKSQKGSGINQRADAHSENNERRTRQPKMCEQEEEDKQQTSHHQVVNVRLEQILIAGKPSLHECRCPYQTPCQDQSKRQTQATDGGQCGWHDLHY